MNATKILTSTVVVAATIGMIGFASAQTATGNAPGTTTSPQTQAQPTIVVPPLPTDPTMQPMPSPAGTGTINSGSTDSAISPTTPATTSTNSTNTSNSGSGDSTSGTMSKDAAAMPNSRASRATERLSNDAGTMRTERAPKADRN